MQKMSVKWSAGVRLVEYKSRFLVSLKNRFMLNDSMGGMESMKGGVEEGEKTRKGNRRSPRLSFHERELASFSSSRPE